MSDYAQLRELYYEALMVIEGTPAGTMMTQEQVASAEKKVREHMDKGAEAVAKQAEEEAKKETPLTQAKTQSEWQAARQAEANKETPAASVPHPAEVPHPATHPAPQQQRSQPRTDK